MGRLVKKIMWYHWNRFSNAGTKGLCLIIIVLSVVAGVKTHGMAALLFFGIGAYLFLLCDRGYGEPDWEDEPKA